MRLMAKRLKGQSLYCLEYKGTIQWAGLGKRKGRPNHVAELAMLDVAVIEEGKVAERRVLSGFEPIRVAASDETSEERPRSYQNLDVNKGL